MKKHQGRTYKGKILFAFVFAIFAILSLNSCTNANSKTETSSDENVGNSVQTASSSIIETSPGQAKAELEKAKKDKKTVFLVVIGNDVKADNILKITKDASNQVKQSVVIQLNRDDAANADLVTQYRLAGAPLPLVIVIAKNGLPAGGMVEQDVTVKNLVDAVPSNKMLEVMTALGEGKSIFIIAYKKSAKDKKLVNESCLKACNQLTTGVTVEIDVEDKTETQLIQQLNIDVSQDITTFVINPSGQITGKHSGIPDATKLIADAKKVVKSGCCPGGSKGSASCKP